MLLWAESMSKTDSINVVFLKRRCIGSDNDIFAPESI